MLRAEMMVAVKWIFVVAGMGCLFVGLNVQSLQILTLEPEKINLDGASWLYIIGAMLLIVPPTIEYATEMETANKRFARLLVVLEVFLVISGMLFFWKTNLIAKIALRVFASLSVTAYLKYGLKELPDFEWSFFYNPLKLVKYHIDCFKGKFGPAYPLSLGIDWLGIGYAFLAFPFGKGALLFGAMYLLISAWRGYKASGKSIPLAWSAINSIYVIYGTFFFIHSII